MFQQLHYDLCVIGGGLNGVGVARDAAGRGMSVLLVEEEDLAGAASSATSKLLNGGVPELEIGDFFRSVKSFKERDVLYKNAQHLLHPVACVMPLYDEGGSKVSGKKAFWRFKLWLYNFLGKGGALPGACIDTLQLNDERLRALKNPVLEEMDDDISVMKPHERLRVLGNITEKDYAHHLAREALVFTGCRVDDTRLVICNAVDAALRGARISTYTSCVGLQVCDGRWCVSLRDMREGKTIDVSASMVVNATGAWVNGFSRKMGIGKNDPDLPQVKFVKDSHIILPRQYKGDHVYMLRQDDGGVVYTMPYEGEYTLVGVAQENYECCDGDIRGVNISEKEVRYLIGAYNAAFEKNITGKDILFSYSAVRPVFSENASGRKSGDYFIYHHRRCDIPLISVYGGKVDSYRVLAQDVVDRLVTFLGRVASGWTASEPLVSAKFQQGNADDKMDMEGYISEKKSDYPWLPDDLLRRYVCAYGVRMEVIIGQAECLSDLGEYYGGGVYEAELCYLRNYEWGFGVEDVLWRRSKLALHVTEETKRCIETRFFSEDTDTSAFVDEEALCA